MKKALYFIIIFIAVIASAGCLNYGHNTGQGFYTFIGIMNLLGTIFEAYCLFKNSKDEK